MKYRCDSVESRMDGSGEIAWDVWALDNDGQPIPARHATVLTPAVGTQEALASGPAALKALLIEHAPAGWDEVALDERVTANLSSASAAEAVQAFVGEIGGFPVDFSLTEDTIISMMPQVSQVPIDKTITSLNEQPSTVDKVVAAVKGVFTG